MNCFFLYGMCVYHESDMGDGSVHGEWLGVMMCDGVWLMNDRQVA